MVALLGLALAGLAGLAVALAAAATRVPEEELPSEELPPEEEEVVEVIDATLRTGHVFWAALTEWRRVHTRYPNEWPSDIDISFAWEIKNTGNTGAYFQVYMFDPGEWLYLEPDDERTVYEEFHTPAIPVSPGYQYYLLSILGRKITGERIGAVWTSAEIEVTYV